MGMAKAKIQPYTRTRSPWRVSERRSAVAVPRTGILPALLVLVMSICVSTSADARRWKWWHYYSSYERSARSGDDDHRRAGASEVPDPAGLPRAAPAIIDNTTVYEILMDNPPIPAEHQRR